MAMDVQASWVDDQAGGAGDRRHGRGAACKAPPRSAPKSCAAAATRSTPRSRPRWRSAVLEPWMSGLGGGGFMVVAKADGRTEVLDFGMIAPAALDPADYPLSGGQDSDLFGWPGVVDDRNVMGPLSIAVPGQAAGLGLAFERHASLPWRDLCAPAIALAEQGLPIGWHASLQITDRRGRSCALRGGRRPFSAGRPAAGAGQRRRPARICRRARLPQTLRRLAEAGPRRSGDRAISPACWSRTCARRAACCRSTISPATPCAGARAAVRIDHGAARIQTPGGLTAGPTLPTRWR